MHVSLQMNYPFLSAGTDMANLELETGKSNFRFNNIGWLSEGQLHPQKGH